MSDDVSTHISALLKQLEEPAAEPVVTEARLLVATDWSKGALPLTALRAFRTLVPTSAPLRLIFAVPHEPSPTDAACIEILVSELGGAAGLQGLDVASFDEVASQPYDCAIVPTDDPEENLVQLGGFILRMRDLMRLHEAGHGGASSAVATNPGNVTALRARLDAYLS